LVLQHIKASLQPTFDPVQFTYTANRSKEDAFVIALHTALSHMEHQGTYVRRLFIELSSAFNTVIPGRLIKKKLPSFSQSICLCLTKAFGSKHCTVQ